jgi:ATP-dependent helicase HrpB
VTKPATLLPPLGAPGADLPVRAVLTELVNTLPRTGTAVLVAPPGSGKTTLVPLALADRLPGRIVVAEPRRVAVRAAARRMATLTGGQVGGAIGYTVRGDRKTGPATRVEVVTTGVLVQRLQRDPELPGVAAIVLDECHERQLDTDLALAFAVDVRANLRDDLCVLATSATAQSERLAAALGPETPVLTARASPYPVDVVWRPPTRPVAAPHGLRVAAALLDHVCDTVRVALRDRAGDVLVFLPGAGEINQVARRLSHLDDVDLLTLHGSQTAAGQDAALRTGPRRRIVLASAVAESSLTVPGVRIVIDAGLSREPRIDHARGLGSLVTVRVSRASAEQRAGRAAREAPGTVYRCWSAADHDRLPGYASPEITTAELSGFMLQLARWGSASGAGLTMLDPVPEAAGAVARATLTGLGAIDADGRITRRGKAMASVGAHPRLARALLDGSVEAGTALAAEVVALLAADGSPAADDLHHELRALRSGTRRDAHAWRTEVRRLTSALPKQLRDKRSHSLTEDLAVALVVGLAYPERLARARGDGSGYLMTGGTAAELGGGSRLSGVEWIAIADADRQPGAATARVRLAAAADESVVRIAAAAMLQRKREVGWSQGNVVARELDLAGAVILSQRPIARPASAELADALVQGLRESGLRLLDFNRDAQQLRDRMRFCRTVFAELWPDVDDDALIARAHEWLGPELARARRREDLSRVKVATALRRLLDWRQAADLDRYAPERLEVPSGSRLRVDYSDPQAPVLAVKVQECFGWTRTPRLAADRVAVVLHLLSPAGRPAAVTSDLESFWRNGYPQVRSELRGRYPRHPWPEDPLTATPTKRTKSRH